MNDSLKKEATEWIKKNRKLLIETFANIDIYKPEDHPLSIFMAGSPGAGKTEFSKNFLKETGLKAVRIDADEIKEIIPQYNRKNSDQIHSASALGVEYLYDQVLDYKQNMILDGTFADYKKSSMNVKRSLKRKRFVEIYYVYQDPVLAWRFTQAREALEGRYVPKEIFVDDFFKAKENMNAVKKEYGEEIKLNVALKNFENKLDKLFLNVEGVDSYIKVDYTPTSLIQLL